MPKRSRSKKPLKEDVIQLAAQLVNWRKTAFKESERSAVQGQIKQLDS